MLTVTAPVIQSADDLSEAEARLDAIMDAPDGSPEAYERSVLSDLIASYEDRHPSFPDGGPIGVLRYLMAEHGVTQRDLPEIGSQSTVSAVLAGKRRINARMAVALGKRFHLPTDAFLL